MALHLGQMCLSSFLPQSQLPQPFFFDPLWCPTVCKEVGLNFPPPSQGFSRHSLTSHLEKALCTSGASLCNSALDLGILPLSTWWSAGVEETRSVAGSQGSGPSCSSAQSPASLPRRVLHPVSVHFFSRRFSGDKSRSALLASEKFPTALSFVHFSCFASPVLWNSASVGFLACSCQGQRDARYLVVLSMLTGNGGLASKSETQLVGKGLGEFDLI